MTKGVSRPASPPPPRTDPRAAGAGDSTDVFGKDQRNPVSGIFFMVSPAHRQDEAHDRDLARRVANYLLGHKLPMLRHIEVESDRGTVTLRGRVFSFYQKQLCINCSRRVAGVMALIDQIDVATSISP
jgi:hypothetical protein